jgi:NAD(P)H-hydrate epimerase
VSFEVWPLVGAAAMRALDRHTIETLGVPGELLMESAGRAVAEAVLALRAPGAPVLVVCGSGNNGGDGLVAARQLHVLGVPVRAALLGPEAKLAPDARANLARARAASVPLEGVEFRPPTGGVVVDAIFGTGLARAVAGAAGAAIARLNAARGACRIVAVDLPSGLDADTGQPLGAAVHADVTVTLGLPKLGLALEPGRTLAGRVVVARIGIAEGAPGAGVAAELLTRAGAGRRLPARPPEGHKGSFGHVLVVAGSLGKTGAAALAVHGALRAGAGLVTAAVPAGLQAVLAVKCTEAMTAPVADTGEHAFAAAGEEAILALARERDVVALGPGIGRAAETCALARGLAKRLEQPLVLDADGLFALGSDPGALKARRAPTIVTPHPGEAGRLLGIGADAVNRDRPAAARRLAERTGACVLLKGAATVVATAEGRVRINPTGGPALGTGGTGDVLAGVAAALLAQGLDAFEAAALGAFVHGLAGDRIAERSGSAGLLAGELADELPAAMEALRAAARASVGSEHLALPFPEPR